MLEKINERRGRTDFMLASLKDKMSNVEIES